MIVIFFGLLSSDVVASNSMNSDVIDFICVVLEEALFFARQPGDGIELELPDHRIIRLKDFHKVDMQIQNLTELGQSNLERLKNDKECEKDEARETALALDHDVR